MRYFLLCVAGLMLSLNLAQATDRKVEVDYSGMEYFFEIAHILKQDREPSEELWNKMFQTSAYQCAIQTEFSKKFFKHYYRLAFKPSEKQALAEELQKEGFYIAYLQHMVELKDRMEPLKSWMEDFRKEDSIFKKALARTSQYLPPGAIEKFPGPKVGFLIFGPDGRGYETILIDLFFFSQNPSYAVSFLAHEFHHHYEAYYSVLQAGRNELVWVCDQVYKEGIADLIDKKENFYGNGSMSQTTWAKKYRELVDQSPQIIDSLDCLLGEMAAEPDRYAENAQKIKDLVPMSGHTLGYYMANALCSEGDKALLMKDFGNPYRFFIRYNRIAKRPTNDYPAFSKDAIKLIRSLDDKNL